jgi:hypothetical protein
MPLNICPSLFYIVPDTKAKSYNENDIFRSDRFRVLQAENLTHIKEILANISTNQPLQVRLLCCYRMKDAAENYCKDRRIDNADKRICSDESGIKTSYIHFHVKMKSMNSIEYLLAFIEGSELTNNTDNMVKELFCSIAWLGITSPEIFLNVFTFGHPVFSTKNVNHLDELINSAKKQVNNEYHGIIDCRVTHINKDSENRLSVSLKNDILFFNPS